MIQRNEIKLKRTIFTPKIITSTSYLFTIILHIAISEDTMYPENIINIPTKKHIY